MFAMSESKIDGKTLPISVIFLTYNEEQNIERSLNSVAGWAGEIYVVDSGSTDRTLEIVQRYTDKIVHHDFENYAQQRNWAQENLPLKFDWVFHIDAGEWVMPELQAALADLFASPQANEVDGLLIRRRTEFMGRWIRYGGHYPSYHLRVFRRQRGRCEARALRRTSSWNPAFLGNSSAPYVGETSALHDIRKTDPKPGRICAGDEHCRGQRAGSTRRESAN